MGTDRQLKHPTGRVSHVVGGIVSNNVSSTQANYEYQAVLTPFGQLKIFPCAFSLQYLNHFIFCFSFLVFDFSAKEKMFSGNQPFQFFHPTNAVSFCKKKYHSTMDRTKKKQKKKRRKNLKHDESKVPQSSFTLRS